MVAPSQNLARATAESYSVGKVGSDLSVRHNYPVEPTKPKDCQAALDKLSGGSQDIELPKEDVAKSATCEISICGRAPHAAKSVSPTEILKAANSVVNTCLVENKVAGATIIGKVGASSGYLTIGHPTSPPFNYDAWWENSVITIGEYTVSREFPGGGRDARNVGNGYEELSLRIFDELRAKFKKAAADSNAVKYKEKLMVAKDKNLAFNFEINYEAKDKVSDMETDDFHLLRILWAVLMNPRGYIPSDAEASVEKGGKYLGKFNVKASWTQDKDDAITLQDITRSNSVQAPEGTAGGEMVPICVWDMYPKKL
ncbi:Uu.00g088860.m01.CDS01 [Anthostomella pinea]|uniref:Uu.00g088860.m01.CDS01 n=1 Tax=Anthostomella pinea TaxID=933095 RepID=A0AAI8VML6_9PEZI|nr:Uu.00g088860.m01.CDS01 [Anthostomella pinea]